MNKKKYLLIAGTAFLAAIIGKSLVDPQTYLVGFLSVGIALKALMTNPSTP